VDATFSPAVDSGPLQNSLEPGKKLRGVVDEWGNGGMGLYQPSNERQLRLQTADRRHLAKSTLHDDRPFRLGIAVTFSFCLCQQAKKQKKTKK